MNYPIIDLKATGANIRALRIAKNLKVEEIANYMGFESEQAIYKWQRGDSLPTLDNMMALSMLLGTPVNEIVLYRKNDAPDLHSRA